MDTFHPIHVCINFGLTDKTAESKRAHEAGWLILVDHPYIFLIESAPLPKIHGVPDQESLHNDPMDLILLNLQVWDSTSTVTALFDCIYPS